MPIAPAPASVAGSKPVERHLWAGLENRPDVRLEAEPGHSPGSPRLGVAGPKANLATLDASQPAYEAASVLDAEAETRVHEALECLMVGRTAIVIAHRLAAVRRTQRICVIVDGCVAEEGTRDILVADGEL